MDCAKPCAKPPIAMHSDRFRKRGTYLTFQDLEDGNVIMRVTTEIKIITADPLENAGKNAANEPISSPYVYGANPDVNAMIPPCLCPNRKGTRNSFRGRGEMQC